MYLLHYIPPPRGVLKITPNVHHIKHTLLTSYHRAADANTNWNEDFVPIVIAPKFKSVNYGFYSQRALEVFYVNV